MFNINQLLINNTLKKIKEDEEKINNYIDFTQLLQTDDKHIYFYIPSDIKRKPTVTFNNINKNVFHFFKNIDIYYENEKEDIVVYYGEYDKLKLTSNAQKNGNPIDLINMNCYSYSTLQILYELKRQEKIKVSHSKKFYDSGYKFKIEVYSIYDPHTRDNILDKKISRKKATGKTHRFADFLDKIKKQENIDLQFTYKNSVWLDNAGLEILTNDPNKIIRMAKLNQLYASLFFHDDLSLLGEIEIRKYFEEIIT